MLEKNIYLKTLAIVVIIGVPPLLFMGAIYGLLSAPEWAIGMIAWVATLLFWASARKRPIENNLTSIAEPSTAVDDDARNRIVHEIRKRKVWIGVLVAVLPIGIANGVAHRAWLPTSAGVAMSLSIVYVAIREIKHQRKRLSLIRASGGTPSHPD